MDTCSLSFGGVQGCEHHSSAYSLFGVCQDRVSGQLIKTQLMTAGRSASRTLGILVHGSLSSEGCLPAQPRWEAVSRGWPALFLPPPRKQFSSGCI